MVYRKRKMYGRKKYGRKRYGRKGRIPRRNLGLSKRYHGVKYFTETNQGLLNIQSLATGTGGNNLAIGVTFSQVPNFATYAQLFQQFAILGVQFIYSPRYNSTSGWGTGNPIPRMFYSENKFNFAPVPIATLQQEDNVKISTCNRGWKKYIRMPMPLLAQLDTSNNAIQVQPKAKTIQWLPTNNHNAQNLVHLSLLICVEDNATAAAIIAGELSVKYYLAFKEQQ